jgi:hypothetical protein
MPTISHSFLVSYFELLAISNFPKHRMPSSSITAEQPSITCCKLDGASPTAQPRVALVDALQLRVYISVLTDEVATLESGLGGASDCFDNSITSLEILRKQRDSTDTTTRRKRELLLDNADRLTSRLMQERNHPESESQSFESIGGSVRRSGNSTKPSVALKLFARLRSRIGAKFR